MYADGDRENSLVAAQFKEIIDTINYEKSSGETLSMMQLVKTPSARKRVTLAISAAVFSTIAGMSGFLTIERIFSQIMQGMS